MEAKISAIDAPKGVLTLWVKEVGFTWLGVLLLSILPAVLFGSGLVSVGVLAVATLIGIPYALFAAATKKDSRNRVFRALAITLAVPTLALVYVFHVDKQIPENATPLIQAIENFRHDTGHYPDSLDALIPNYLPALPVVRLSVFEPLISYRITDGKPYLAIPSAMGDMFARFEYSFVAKVWVHHF